MYQRCRLSIRKTKLLHFGYKRSGLSDEESIDRAAAKNQFSEMIFDSKAMMIAINVYTYRRSIKYPVAKSLVTLLDSVRVNVWEIEYAELDPGPHGGHIGA